jgi:hypothetical protein
MVHRACAILFILMGVFVSGVSSGATPLESLIPKRDIPKEWTLIHGPQTYDKKTLFEHINGQAELYLKYGFRQSAFAIYQDKNKTKNQIEVDIYDMGNVVQAFGVFSRFRNEDRPGGFGLDSFLDDHTALFYKGKYYVMLYATESNPDSLFPQKWTQARIYPIFSGGPFRTSILKKWLSRNLCGRRERAYSLPGYL